MGERFLRLSEVAEILDVSMSQVYALVRNGELESIKIGGRGQYRVEREKLEDYIAKAYRETRAFLDANPLSSREEVPAEAD
jgi:excisionase family DNA binding protein